MPPPYPLGPDQILATAIAVTESRSGRPDPHSGNHHRRDCYRHAAIVRGKGGLLRVTHVLDTAD